MTSLRALVGSCVLAASLTVLACDTPRVTSTVTPALSPGPPATTQSVATVGPTAAPTQAPATQPPPSPPPATPTRPAATAGAAVNVNVTGAWSGTARNAACSGEPGATDPAMVRPWSGTFIQSGNAVTGTFSFAGQTFPIRGVVTGMNFTFLASSTTIDTGFEAIVTERSLSGTYTASPPNAGACPSPPGPQRATFQGSH